ncbi:hypothetical protein AB205_0102120, partial [Aquarana catesbeiana]
HSWEMVGKKKGVSGQKEAGPTEPNEETRENKDRERDFSRRRGGAPRRGRGSSRGREFRAQENGLEGGKSGGSSGRGTERGRRGRGRGRESSTLLTTLSLPPMRTVTATPTRGATRLTLSPTMEQVSDWGSPLSALVVGGSFKHLLTLFPEPSDAVPEFSGRFCEEC